MDFDSRYWGDFPSWAIVIVTLIGVIAAIKAGKIAIKASNYAKRVVEIEQARDSLRDSTAARAQASAVSAWTEIFQNISPSGVQIGMHAVANNESDLPIYNVNCHWYVKRINENSYTSVSQYDAGLVPPHTPFRWPLDLNELRQLMGSELPPNPSVEQARDLMQRSRVEITFLDAEHISWIRAYDGRLNVGPSLND